MDIKSDSKSSSGNVATLQTLTVSHRVAVPHPSQPVDPAAYFDTAATSRAADASVPPPAPTLSLRQPLSARGTFSTVTSLSNHSSSFSDLDMPLGAFTNDIFVLNAAPPLSPFGRGVSCEKSGDQLDAETPANLLVGGAELQQIVRDLVSPFDATAARTSFRMSEQRMPVSPFAQLPEPELPPLPNGSSLNGLVHRLTPSGVVPSFYSLPSLGGDDETLLASLRSWRPRRGASAEEHAQEVVDAAGLLVELISRGKGDEALQTASSLIKSSIEDHRHSWAPITAALAAQSPETIQALKSSRAGEGLGRLFVNVERVQKLAQALPEENRVALLQALCSNADSYTHLPNDPLRLKEVPPKQLVSPPPCGPELIAFLSERSLAGQLEAPANEARIPEEWQKFTTKHAAEVGAAPHVVPPLLHTVWLGGHLPRKYFARMQTFARQNPNCTQVLWTNLRKEDFANMPRDESRNTIKFCQDHNVALINVDDVAMAMLQHEGVAELYQEHLLHRQYAAASDVLRLVVLKHMGGTYVDADRRCYQPLDALRTHALVLVGDSFGTQVTINDFIMSSPQHPAIEEVLGYMRNPRVFDQTFNWGYTFSREDEHIMSSTGPIALRTGFQRWKQRADAAAIGQTFILPEHYTEGEGMYSVIDRTSEATWADSLRPQEFYADRQESPEQREDRLTACVLDDVRNFGDSCLERYAALNADPQLSARVLKRVAGLIVDSARGGTL